MTTVSAMLKIKLHVTYNLALRGYDNWWGLCSWPHFHFLKKKTKNRFYDRCHQRYKELIALAWPPRRDTAWYLGFTSYTVMACLIPHLPSLPCFWWMPICLSPTYHGIKEMMKNSSWACLQYLRVALPLEEEWLSSPVKSDSYRRHEWRNNAQLEENTSIVILVEKWGCTNDTTSRAFPCVPDLIFGDWRSRARFCSLVHLKPAEWEGGLCLLGTVSSFAEMSESLQAVCPLEQQGCVTREE